MKKNILIITISLLSIIGFIFLNSTKDTKKVVSITSHPIGTKTIMIDENIVTNKEQVLLENKDKIPLKNTDFKSNIKLNPKNNHKTLQTKESVVLIAFKKNHPKMIDEIQKIPECLEKSENKKEAYSCNDALRILQKEMSLAMGDFTEENITRYDEDFIWDEETKLNMINEIENSLAPMQEVQTCIESATTSSDLNKCLK